MKRLLTTNILLIYVLIILGGAVRNFGAGLSCPDWPLCQGHIIPAFDFLVLLEWTHRLLALIVSLLTIAIVALWATRPFERRRLGLVPIWSALLLATQAVLGGMTVLQLLNPATVSLHLATGLMFWGSILWMWLRVKDISYAPSLGLDHANTWLGGLTLAYYGQAVLGALVSSTHAGLVCPDFPLCHGALVPPLMGLYLYQFMHRVGAVVVLVLTTGCFFSLRRMPVDRKLRMTVGALAGMTIFQFVLGVGNVLARLPAAMSITHLAVAASLFGMSAIAWYKVANARISAVDQTTH